MADDSRVEQILRVILGQEEELPNPQSRVEELLIELNTAIVNGGTAHADLAALIAANQAAISVIQNEQLAQNAAINSCIPDSDIVICEDEDEYNDLEEKTALLYLIPEEA